jgi:tetratricopeptide (TPR) repeat protein
VNLSDILHDDDDEPQSARMTIGEPKQTGDHEADFQHILQEFRDGIERTIPSDDADSHFDLGIAFREMGLIDDAIAEFQIASRSRLRRVESIEALGGCFLDKHEPAVARTLLLRALDEPSVANGDDTLRGVLYLLGLASEALGAREDGLRYYQRVYAVDIRFRDVAARIQTLQQPA